MRRKILVLALFGVLLVLPGCWVRAAMYPEGTLRNLRGNGQKEDKKKEPKKKKVEEKP